MTKTGSLLAVIAFFVLTFLVPAAFAVPQAINYQGYIESGGAPVNDTVSMTFSIYNTPTGGSALWTETQSSVNVTDGAFSVALGSVFPIDLPFDEQYYLGVDVNGDGEMTPRATLASVPYAMRAKEADGLAGAGSVPSGFSIFSDTPAPPPGYTYTGVIFFGGEAWTAKASMLYARYGLAAAAVNGKVYAIGGSPWETVNEEYDPATDTWVNKTAMPTARFDFAAVAVGDKIYAIGGIGGGPLSTNEEYDPATSTWTTKAPMPTARLGLAAATVNGKVYALGGHYGPSYYTNNEEYDPDTNTWTAKAAMPTARGILAAVGAEGKVYAIGGSTPGTYYATNEEYDPASDTWATKTPMSTARMGLAAVAVGGKVYALGGNNTSYLATSEEYELATDTWVAMADMPTARSTLAAATVNGKVYAIGGADESSYLTTNEEYDLGIRFIHTKD